MSQAASSVELSQFDCAIKVTVDIRDFPMKDRIRLFTTEMQRLGITSVLNKVPGAIDAVEGQLEKLGWGA